MLFKIIIFGLLIAIVLSLGSAMFGLVKDQPGKRRVLNSLTWRVGLAMALLLVLAVGYLTGQITPHGLLPH